jgi:hypothetical protein
LLTEFLCLTYNSQNKHGSFPWKALHNFFLQRDVIAREAKNGVSVVLYISYLKEFRKRKAYHNRHNARHWNLL